MTWIPDPAGASLAMENRDGVLWADARVHRRWQHHRAQTRALHPVLGHTERCACGAFGPAPWSRLDPWPTRKQRKSRSNRVRSEEDTMAYAMEKAFRSMAERLDRSSSGE